MADLSINSEQKYSLNGVNLNAPIEWQDVTIEADYVNDSVQPSLTIEAFTFALESRESINQWIADGLTSGVGIFEGMPFGLTIYNKTSNQTFKAFLDFTKDYQDFIDDGKLKVSIIKDNSLDNFFEKVDSYTYGFLETQIAITYDSIDYCVEKKGNAFEILMLGIVLYLMTKEMYQLVDKLADNVGKAVSAATPSIGVGATGPVVIPVSIGGLIYAVLSVALQILYMALTLIVIINLATQIFEILVQPKRKHKCIKLKDALTYVCMYLGYNLVTPISELDYLYYLPSNPNMDEVSITGLISIPKGTQKGIPNTLDYGYNCGEMFEIAKKCFNAKIAIIGNDVHLRSENDAYWMQQSTWSMPDILIKQIQFNTDDLKANKIISFDTDLNDDYTIDNFTGTNIEIRTQAVTVVNEKAVLLKGLDEVKINVALGNRKDKLNNIENVLKTIGGFIDGATGIFGGGSNFAAKIQNKVGILKVSNNWTALPKLLYVVGGKLPTNHRNLWCASALYDNYHNYKSFVLNNFYGQKKIYSDVVVPFGLTDFNILTENSYFFYKGSQAKITKFVWKVGSDTATISFWVREIYTKNLKEIQIIP